MTEHQYVGVECHCLNFYCGCEECNLDQCSFCTEIREMMKNMVATWPSGAVAKVDHAFFGWLMLEKRVTVRTALSYCYAVKKASYRQHNTAKKFYTEFINSQEK